MYEKVDKSKENKSRAVANSVAQEKNDGKQGFEFVDNRPKSIVQQKLQIISNHYSTESEQNLSESWNALSKKQEQHTEPEKARVSINPIQCHIFRNGSSISLVTASRILNIALGTPEYRKLSVFVDSDKHYLIEDMYRLLGIDKKIWKSTGSTRPDSGEVTGKIGSIDEPGSVSVTEQNSRPFEVSNVEGLGSVEANMELEENLGSMLINSEKVKAIAQQIHKITAKNSSTTDQEIRQKAYTDKDSWGGAQGFMHSKEGVDESVYATTKHFEITMKARGGDKEYQKWKSDYPKENVLYERIKSPGFSFDKAIENVEPIHWTQQTKDEFYEGYKSFSKQNQQKPESQEFIIEKLQTMPKQDLGKELKRLLVRNSRSMNLAGETASPLEVVNERGSGYRQSNSGRQFNIITHAPYKEEADQLKKPVLSGPSGTAFRYIKAWIDIKKLNKGKGPSIEDALLVTLANLLPPNGHHSYHEIMDGVNGLGGLKYIDRKGYGDIGKIRPSTIDRAKKLVLTKTSHQVRQQNVVKGKKHFYI